MPIVPVVDQNTTGMPTVQAPAAAPMHNYAPQQQEQLGATEQAAGVASMRNNQEIALHIQGQLDDANVKAAESKFIQSATDTLHGDHGYMNLRGADAINGYDPASQALVKSKKDILDSLSNDIQKVQFNRISQQHLVTLGAQMSQHRAQQRVQYTATQSMARADSMRSMAQNSDIGSEDQNRYIETGVQETKSALSAQGIPADSPQAQEAERKFRSQITADNVSRKMEDGDYLGAQSILTDAMSKNQVEGDTADRLRRAIRGNLQRTENIQQAEDIFAPYAGKQVRATDLETMLGQAQKIENPEQRQHVQDMVRAKFNEQHTMQAAEYRDNLNDVVNFKAKNNGSLKGVDPVKWGQLSPADQADLQRPPAQETDINTLYGFVTNPESITVDNVKSAWGKGKLSKESFISLTNEAMRMSNKPQYVQEAQGIDDRIEHFAFPAGIPLKNLKTDEDQKNAIDLKYRIQTEIESTKQQQNGKITGDQVDKIIKKQVEQRILSKPSHWYNPFSWGDNTEKKFNFQIPQGAAGKVLNTSDGKLHWTDATGKNDLGVAE